MSKSAKRFGGLAILILTTASASADAPSVLRYRFTPGQELTFRSVSEFKYGEGQSAGTHGTKDDTTAWVVRANPDGSFRLVLREKSVFSMGHGQTTRDQPAQTRLVYADVFPDGQVTINKTIQYRGHPGTLFPRLPKDQAEAAKGWEGMRGEERTICKPVSGPNGSFAFEATTDSPMNKVYLSTHKTRYTFDLAKGFVTKGEGTNSQGYGFNGKGTHTNELLAVKTTPADQLKEFAAAADGYFTAADAYEKQTDAAEKAPPEEAKKILAKALDGLKAATDKMKQAEFKTSLEEKVKDHERMVKYYLEDAERRAKVMGRPAAEFETTDMDGKKVKLSDLNGQVVVLDFWYRGCGWCIKAMPQINQLAADFAGKPVAIFGMNTDRDEKDAKLVIQTLALRYPTLKAEGLPEKFGVQGFPTLIVIDQQGKVADIHVGYSTTLHEDLGRQIRNLLEKKSP